MCSPHSSPLLLVLVTLTLVALVSSQSPAKVGDQCCLEDWNPSVGKVFQAFKTDLMNFAGGGFLKELGRWKGAFGQYYTEEEPEGICKGQLNMVCNSDTKKCECNLLSDTFKYVMNKGNFCVGGQDAFCKGEFNAVGCKNKYFKCIQNPGWPNGNEYCKLDDDAPRGAEDWVEWGGEMYTADGKLMDMNMKGHTTPTQSPSFRILIFILALTLPLPLDLVNSMCHL